MTAKIRLQYFVLHITPVTEHQVKNFVNEIFKVVW